MYDERTGGLSKNASPAFHELCDSRQVAIPLWALIPSCESGTEQPPAGVSQWHSYCGSRVAGTRFHPLPRAFPAVSRGLGPARQAQAPSVPLRSQAPWSSWGLLLALTPTWSLPPQPTSRSSWCLCRECSQDRRRLPRRGGDRDRGSGWVSSAGRGTQGEAGT